MALPSSLWVKFKPTTFQISFPQGLSQFLIAPGTQATMSPTGADSAEGWLPVDDPEASYKLIIAGGVVDRVDVYVLGDLVATFGVLGPGETAVFDMAEARDARLPKLLELPFVASVHTGKYQLIMDGGVGDDHVTVTIPVEGAAYLDVVFGGDSVVGSPFSFSLDANNVGTTDCPFVEWVGELATVETFTTSGPWTPPANIDTTKPVIVECWGAGANGGDGTTGAGADGGGGGAYSSSDVSTFIPTAQYAVDFDGWVRLADDGDSVVVAATADGSTGAPSLAGIGDVKFSGGDGAAAAEGMGGNGGSAALPYQNGVNGGGGAGSLGDTLADAGTSSGDGGGGGYGDGAYQAGGTGAGGLVKIHYSLLIIVPTPELEIVPAEGSRKTIRVDGVSNVVSGSPVVGVGESVRRLGDGSGGVSTAGPKFGCQEFVVRPGENLE